MNIPDHPKIYHITHMGNLPQLVSTGWLLSDARRIQKNVDCRIVGMSTIKKRRLEDLEVSCHPGTNVGEYAPFYFCPRSIMLYILHMGNHPELDYREGQIPIVHLQADLHAVVAWAGKKGRAWAFSDSNAGARYASFYNELDDLSKVNWDAVDATDFRQFEIKEGKQAEFLVHRSLPWKLVEKIGVFNKQIARRVSKAISQSKHQPPVSVERAWYY